MFSNTEQALKAIDAMKQIHAAVEEKRRASIPDWAYRDVLFMLIHYSIASFELLERKLTIEEKMEVFDVFFRVGSRMGLKGLPSDFHEWVEMREHHLENDMKKSEFTVDLFKQYRKHLGAMRYFVLIEGQKLVVPVQVKKLLQFSNISVLSAVVPLYKFSRSFKFDGIIKSAILPSDYKKQIRELDVVKG